MGSYRYRKSIGLGKGIKLNVGKSGITSVSFGVPGMRHTVGKGGRRTTSVGVPGTGFSKQYRSGQSRASSRQPIEVPSPPKPGLFAASHEKAFYEGIQAYLAKDYPRAHRALQTAAEKAPNWPAPYLFGALVAVQTGDSATAIARLEWVIASAQSLPDAVTAKYTSHLSLPIPITESATVRVRFGSIAAALLLIELYQEAERLDEAIGLAQALLDANPSNHAVRLSLCDLLFQDGDPESVVEVAQGITNDDDITLSILHLKAQALLVQDMTSVAISELTGALKKTSGRDPDILRAIRYDRAAAYEAAGQAAKARADLEKLYADAPRFRDVEERLRTQVAAPLKT